MYAGWTCSHCGRTHRDSDQCGCPGESQAMQAAWLDQAIADAIADGDEDRLEKLLSEDDDGRPTQPCEGPDDYDDDPRALAKAEAAYEDRLFREPW